MRNSERKARTFPNDKATNEWLDSEKPSTRETYAVSWNHFLEFVKLTGDQILADRLSDKEYHWEQKVIDSKAWAMQTLKLAQNSAKTITTAARSFFQYHRTPLQFRRQESRRMTEARTKQENYRFSLEDLKKLYDVADLTEKYVVTAGKSFGLRAGDFLSLTRGHMEPYILREVPISLGTIDTEKEVGFGVKAYPFIDIDAQPIIKQMLEKMTRDGRTSPSDRILTYADEVQLTRVLKRLTKKAGLITGDKRIRFHCLRSFLSDRLSSHMSESKWKQIVGKKISEAAYIGIESLREDYKKVMPETCFTKNFGDLDKRLREVEDIKKQLSPELLKRMQDADMLRSKTTKGRRYLAETEPDKKKEPCQDGKHCQKLVSETELTDLLREGWRVVATLPSGKIVISNET